MFSRKKFKDVKSLINLSNVRVNNIRKKANQELAVKKRVLAKHLQEGEYALARLEAERIVKLDWKVEAMNIIEIKGEEIRDNVPLLDSQKTVPVDLEEAVASIIYAEEKAGVPELKQVVEILIRKYGQEFVELQRTNSSQLVEERLIHRLSGQRPNAFLVYNYMKEIAKNFGIEFIDDEVTRKLGERFDVPMTAGAPGVSSASGLGSAAYAITDGKILKNGQKPPGFLAPAPAMADFEDIEKRQQDGGDDGGEGGEVEAKPAWEQDEPKPAPAPVKKAPQPKSNNPDPKPKAKPADPLADLQARFDKLQDL